MAWIGHRRIGPCSVAGVLERDRNRDDLIERKPGGNLRSRPRDAEPAGRQAIRFAAHLLAVRYGAAQICRPAGAGRDEEEASRKQPGGKTQAPPQASFDEASRAHDGSGMERASVFSRLHVL